MPLCFEVVDLPPEIITHIVSFLSSRDLTNVCLSCKLFRDVALQDCIWQQRCREDFNFTNNEGWNATYKDIYTKVLHTYGRAVGLWQTEIRHYGGLVHVQFEEGRIIGRKCIAPVAPNVLDPLRLKTLFTIQFSQDQEDVEIFCHTGFSEPHKGCLQWVIQKEDSKLLFRCLEMEHHQHPEGKQREFEEWLVEETGRPPIEFFVHGQELLLMKFLATTGTQLGFNYLISRLEQSPSRSSAVIQPGLFKGTYGVHGIEIIQLKYDENGKGVQGIKITGDPNVPATKLSFEVDLAQPIILTDDQQLSVDLIEQIDLPELPPDTDILQLPPQSFVVPADCLDRSQNAPRMCRARFQAKGQIAGHGYNSPGYTPGHWVVFGENLFGFLWLKLRSFSMYSRVAEDLWSCGPEDGSRLSTHLL